MRTKPPPLDVQLAERRRERFRNGTLSKHHPEARRFKQEYAMQQANEPNVNPYHWYIQFIELPPVLQPFYKPGDYYGFDRVRSYASYVDAYNVARMRMLGATVAVRYGKDMLAGRHPSPDNVMKTSDQRHKRGRKAEHIPPPGARI